MDYPTIGNSNTQAMLKMAKNIWFVPSFTEFLTFAAIILLLFIMFSLFHNNSVQVAVRKNSRCLRAKDIGRTKGQYIATAMNKQNQNLYRVGYDLSSTQTTLECACPQGKVANTFRNIPLYNLSTQTATNVKEKLCSCDQLYHREGESVYYSGYPGIVSFMNSGDLSFFRAAQDNSVPS
jgi:hypothetical protein